MLNDFEIAHNHVKIIELGCGRGNEGVDVLTTANFPEHMLF